MRISRRTITACFLISGMFPPVLVPCISEIPGRGKKSGTICVPEGGSDPETLFGRLEAEKVGSLPPDLTFFPRPLSLLLRIYLFADQWISIRRSEERAPKKVQKVISTF